MTNVLRVKAAGSALVPDYEAMDGGVLRFIGRKHDPKIGKNGGWVPTEQAAEVPHRIEYLQELRAGALLPADEQTAKLAGVAWRQDAPKGA